MHKALTFVEFGRDHGGQSYPQIVFLERLIPGLKPTTCHLCAWFVKNMIRLIFQLLAAFHFSSYFTVYMLF